MNGKKIQNIAMKELHATSTTKETMLGLKTLNQSIMLEHLVEMVKNQVM